MARWPVVDLRSPRCGTEPGNAISSWRGGRKLRSRRGSATAWRVSWTSALAKGPTSLKATKAYSLRRGTRGFQLITYYLPSLLPHVRHFSSRHRGGSREPDTVSGSRHSNPKRAGVVVVGEEVGKYHEKGAKREERTGITRCRT